MSFRSPRSASRTPQAKLDQRDLRWTLIPSRHDDRSDTASDINLRILSTMQTARQLSTRQNALFGIAHFNLTAVRVAAQRQNDICTDGLSEYHGVVRKQNLHLVGKRSVKCSAHVSFPCHKIVDA